MDLVSLKASAAAAAKKAVTLGTSDTPPAPDDLTDAEKEEWGRLFSAALREIELELNGTPNNIPPATDRLAAYVGTVASIESGWVIQNLGRGQQVAHSLQDFPTPPQTGDEIKVTRKNGEVSLLINKTTQQQGQSKGRSSS